MSPVPEGGRPRLGDRRAPDRVPLCHGRRRRDLVVVDRVEDRFFVPTFWTLRSALSMREWMSVVIALVMARSARRIAGGRTRTGALGLLLPTRVNSLKRSSLAD